MVREPPVNELLQSYLEKPIDWVCDKLNKILEKKYTIYDCRKPNEEFGVKPFGILVYSDGKNIVNGFKLSIKFNFHCLHQFLKRFSRRAAST